jgi:hypothetical protein
MRESPAPLPVRRPVPGNAVLRLWPDELADMAVERTPPASRERSDRALAAAEAWFAAGDLPATRERAAALYGHSARSGHRAIARPLLRPQ